MRYVNIGTMNSWRYAITMNTGCGLFRNVDGVKPGRWGFYIYALEIGSRRPGDRIGVFLRKCYLWPW